MQSSQDDPTALGQFIPLHYHANMLRDRARMAGFKEAIEKTVPPGGRVLELGGGTGALSFFAAQKASKVWCVEKNPELVRAARRFLSLNPGAERVEVVEADAMDYLPPEPVDVVICEMLHVAMLREKQIEMIHSFKGRYREKFGAKLPRFIPEAAILAVQPVFQNFHFEGFYAPTPVFYDPLLIHDETRGLGDPVNYRMFLYRDELLLQFEWEGTLAIHTDGKLNGLRFITKNLLAILPDESRSLEWFSQYLVVPAPESLAVKKGDRPRLRLSYPAGGPLEALTESLRVTSG